MESDQVRRVFEWVDKFLIWVALLIVVLLLALYGLTAFGFYHLAADKWPALRELLMGICINLIPVFLIAVGSYLFLREYRKIQSDQETNELANQIADRIRTALPEGLVPSVEVDVLQGQLVIMEGTYGAEVPTGQKDVTRILTSMVAGGRLELRGEYNTLFGGDPAEYTPKKLVVTYVHDGKEVSITVPENTELVLPVPLSWHTKSVSAAPSTRDEPRSVLLRAWNHCYVYTEGGRGSAGEVSANRDRVETREALRWIDQGNNRLALQTRTGYYLCAEAGGGGKVVANRDKLGVWETFMWVDLRDEKIALQTHEGFFLRVADDDLGTVVADRKEIGDQEMFRLIPS